LRLGGLGHELIAGDADAGGDEFQQLPLVLLAPGPVLS
jgi:hypothetical protein